VRRPEREQDGEIRRLTTLLEVSQALSGTLDLTSALRRALESLEQHHEVLRGAVMLVHEDTQDIRIEAAIGITTEGQRARYQFGEGITGRAVESQKPIVVPEVSKEPLFLNRAVPRSSLGGAEVSFFCVPIILEKKAVGALGVDLEFQKSRDYDGVLRFLKVVASMLAQALKVHRIIEAERKKLLEENVHLRRELKERYDFSNLVASWAPAGPCATSTSRWPRWRAPPPRCSCAASPGPGRS
jgi:Nif-specific regulatory protein